MVLIAPNLPKEGQSWHGLMASFFESIGMDFPPLVEQRDGMMFWISDDAEMFYNGIPADEKKVLQEKLRATKQAPGCLMKPLGYAGWQHVPCYFMFGKNDNAYLPALAEMLVKQPGFMKEPVVNWVDAESQSRKDRMEAAVLEHGAGAMVEASINVCPDLHPTVRNFTINIALHLAPDMDQSAPSIGRNEECAICYEAFEPGQTLSTCMGCQTNFHNPCLEDWLRQERQGAATCPNCRMRIEAVPRFYAVVERHLLTPDNLDDVVPDMPQIARATLVHAMQMAEPAARFVLEHFYAPFPGPLRRRLASQLRQIRSNPLESWGYPHPGSGILRINPFRMRPDGSVWIYFLDPVVQEVFFSLPFIDLENVWVY